MKILKFALSIVVLMTMFLSCDPDDVAITPFVERDRAEQQADDKDALTAYLSTHYYNSAFFQTGTNHKYSDIVISELPKDEEGNYLDLPDPDQNTLLSQAVVTYTNTYLDVAYEYYVLRINEGGGAQPKFTDAVRYRFEGSNVQTEAVFQSITAPDVINLQGDLFSGGAIKGWQLVMPTFKVAESYTTGSDGVVNYNNFGLGVMFLPSGLAYFSSATTAIPAYSNLIFKFELLQYQEMDHDGDGVASYLEDLDGDLDVTNDDTDEDGLPNFIDFDDDGDGVATRFEDIDGDGDPTNDIGANGIPKYLDPEETESTEVE